MLGNIVIQAARPYNASGHITWTISSLAKLILPVSNRISLLCLLSSATVARMNGP